MRLSDKDLFKTIDEICKFVFDSAADQVVGRPTDFIPKGITVILNDYVETTRKKLDATLIKEIPVECCR